ncbi:hypothetical protein Vretimale_12227 [Volvox reticuliferus]|uniref:Uncharacterized protein n=1 Tax=Volvox reticuliferus TaxID=1737510 RepID=A0A8J4LSI4_9CHLO|nr:hypothetical protein Vretifemale_8864 [Volvox reticuliferus]GIM08159.1 hypothetical protein Vretimale_12227 [Volvox reticuliferus]
MAVEGLTSIAALTSLQRVHTTTAPTGTCLSLEVAMSLTGFSEKYLQSCVNKRAKTADPGLSYSRAVDGGQGNETLLRFTTPRTATSGLSAVKHERGTIADVESSGCVVAGTTAHAPMQRTLSAPVSAPVMWLTADAFAPGTPPTFQLLTHASPSGSPPLPAWAPRVPRSIGSMDRAVCHNHLHGNQGASQGDCSNNFSHLAASTLSSSSLLTAAFRRCLNDLGKVPEHSGSGDGHGGVADPAPSPSCPFPPAPVLGRNRMMNDEAEASSPGAVAQLLTSAGVALPTASTATSAAAAAVAAADAEESGGISGHVHPGEIHEGDGVGAAAVITVVTVAQEDSETDAGGAAAAHDEDEGDGDEGDGHGHGEGGDGSGTLLPTFAAGELAPGASCPTAQAAAQVASDQVMGGCGGEAGDEVQLVLLPPYELNCSSIWRAGNPRGKPPLPRAHPRAISRCPSGWGKANVATASPSETKDSQGRDEQSAPVPLSQSSCIPRGIASPFGEALNLSPDPDSESRLHWGGAKWTRLTSPFAQLAEQQRTVQQPGRDDQDGWKPAANYGYDEQYSNDYGYGTGDAFVSGAAASSHISQGPVTLVASVQVGGGDAAASADGRCQWRVSMDAAAAMESAMDDDELDDYYLNTLCGGCDPLAAFMQQELARSKDLDQVCSQEEPKEVREEAADKSLVECSVGTVDGAADKAEQALPPLTVPPPPYELQQQYQPAPLEAGERGAASTVIGGGTVPHLESQLHGLQGSWSVPFESLPLQHVDTPAVALPPFQPVPAAAAASDFHPMPLPPPPLGFHSFEEGKLTNIMNLLTEVDSEDQELGFERCLTDGPYGEAALTEAVTSPRISSGGSQGDALAGTGAVTVVDDAAPLVAAEDVREMRHGMVSDPCSLSPLPPLSPQSPPQPQPQSPQAQLVVVTGACCHFHATELHSSHELQLRQQLEALQLQAQQQLAGSGRADADEDAVAGLTGGTCWGCDHEDATGVLCSAPGTGSCQDLQEWASPEVRDVGEKDECGDTHDSRGLVVMLERVKSCAHCSVATDVRQMVELVVWSNCFWEMGAVAAEGHNKETAPILGGEVC